MENFQTQCLPLSAKSPPHIQGPISQVPAKLFSATDISTCLLQNYLPWMEPLQVDNSQDKIEDGGGDDEDGELPGQPGQQLVGLILLGECPNVFAEIQVLFPHIVRLNRKIDKLN